MVSEILLRLSRKNNNLSRSCTNNTIAEVIRIILVPRFPYSSVRRKSIFGGDGLYKDVGYVCMVDFKLRGITQTCLDRAGLRQKELA